MDIIADDGDLPATVPHPCRGSKIFLSAPA